MDFLKNTINLATYSAIGSFTGIILGTQLCKLNPEYNIKNLGLWSITGSILGIHYFYVKKLIKDRANY